LRAVIGQQGILQENHLASTEKEEITPSNAPAKKYIVIKIDKTPGQAGDAVQAHLDSVGVEGG
jgi:hypothetical protein